MKNIVKYLGCDSGDEFEYYIDVNGQKIIVFNGLAGCMGVPYELIPEHSYPIMVYLFFIDDCQIEAINEKKYAIEKADSSYYAYYLYGKLKDNKLDLNGFIVEDEIFSNYKQLDGKFVKVKADRIDVKF